MKPPVEHVRVSSKGKEILIKLKRVTGLKQWNELCRIAFCKSLAMSTPPQKCSAVPDSNIDMEWKTFAGKYHDELIAMTVIKAKMDGIYLSDDTTIAEYIRDHLERGLLVISHTKNIQMLSCALL